jgi:hypothetical protein
MKRFRVTVLLAVMLLVRAAFSGVVFAADINAVVGNCSGTVEIKAPGGEWVQAEPGMTLESRTMVSTGFRSNALLHIGNSSILVRPLTRLSLEQIIELQNNEQVELNLRAGRIHATVTPPREKTVDFKVTSPVATASVRGTEFEFDAINLTVRSGTVVYTGSDNATVFAAAGKFTTVDQQGRSAAPASGEAGRLTQTGGGLTVNGSAAAEEVKPVSPVVSGPGGIVTVPGILGSPGGGVSNPPPGGDVQIGSAWR